MEKEINDIKSIKSSLESYLQLYNESKRISQTETKEKDRSNASKRMILYANSIERMLLMNKLVSNEISSNNQCQFEGFWEHVDFYLPDYIIKIDCLLERLQSKKDDL